MSDGRECCELCFWEKDAGLIKAVEIDGQTHYICMECEVKIRNAPYADEKAKVVRDENL
jgi:hypothetical protein